MASGSEDADHKDNDEMPMEGATMATMWRAAVGMMVVVDDDGGNGERLRGRRDDQWRG